MNDVILSEVKNLKMLKRVQPVARLIRMSANMTSNVILIPAQTGEAP